MLSAFVVISNEVSHTPLIPVTHTHSLRPAHTVKKVNTHISCFWTCMWGPLGLELELNLAAERERGRKGGGNLRDERGNKTSSGPAQAEGSRPRIHTSQHRSMAPTAAGGGGGESRWMGSREHQAIFSLSEAAMVERRGRSQRRPTRMSEHGFACK